LILLIFESFLTTFKANINFKAVVAVAVIGSTSL
jgi:hypothetical protein